MDDFKCITHQANSIQSVIPRGSICLAPMVRINSLSFRSLCLNYGADVVWSEEIVDKKLMRAKRCWNEKLNTYDYTVDNAVIFQTSAAVEGGRIILQLGTNDAVSALMAAKVVMNDVAGNILNVIVTYVTYLRSQMCHQWSQDNRLIKCFR